jgi:hypothetical protein
VIIDLTPNEIAVVEWMRKGEIEKKQKYAEVVFKFQAGKLKHKKITLEEIEN